MLLECLKMPEKNGQYQVLANMGPTVTLRHYWWDCDKIDQLPWTDTRMRCFFCDALGFTKHRELKFLHSLLWI